MTDAKNCGTCGVVCKTGQTCKAGSCECPTGQKLCGGKCIDTTSDAANCGACGTACKNNQICTASKCGCKSNQIKCNNRCFNPNTSANHCGKCGNACSNGETCQSGTCKCPTGQKLCGGKCVDTTSDAANCGGCGTVCATGATCTTSQCTCPTNQKVCGGKCVSQNVTACGSACVNIKRNNNHCGGCNVKCSSTQSCQAGSCKTTVSFKTNVYPILKQSCSCHTNGRGGLKFGSTSASTYSSIVNQTGSGGTYVKPYQANNSYMYTRMLGTSGGSMPPAGKLGNAKLNTVRDWILQGAKNN